MKIIQKGFTLIELMVTLVVLGILLSLGAPSFTAWIRDSRIDGIAQNTAAALKLARSEAVTRQAVVTVNWSDGDIYVDANGAGDAFNAAADTLIKDGLNLTGDGVTIDSSSDDNFLSFRTDGTLNEPAGITLGICDSRGAAEGWDITVNTVGRTTLEQPSADCTP